MIYELSRDVEVWLRAREFPCVVTYGSKIAEPDNYPYMVRFERDREGQDSVGPPKGSQKNPRKKATRTLAAKFTVWARSNLEGAHQGDHEREAEKLIDAVIAALIDWGTEGRSTVTFGAGTPQGPADRNDTTVWPGVRYEQKFSVTRGVFVRDFAGDARPTGSFEGVTSTFEVKQGGEYEPVV